MKILSDDQLIFNLIKENNFSDAAKQLFEIQKERTGREAGVLCSPNSQNSNFVSQSLSDNYQYLT